MKEIKRIMKTKKSLAEMELFYQEELQTLLTKEVEQQVSEMEEGMFRRIKAVSDIGEIDVIKKEYKQAQKIVAAAKKLDKEISE